jgi:hypothetical protein
MLAGPCITASALAHERMTYSTREVISVGLRIDDRFEQLLLTANYSSKELLRTSACLALSVGEGYRATIALLSSMGQSYIPVVQRSMLEAVVDLKLLCDDPGHLEQMQYDNAKQYLRVFREFRADEAAQFDDDAKMVLDGAIEIERAIFDRLESEERAKSSIRRKFERAGMLDLYRSVYAYLCSFAHNNVNMLRQRHGASGNIYRSD